MSGRLIGVVGPSGVGKDTVMRAIAAADPGIGIVRRVITRAPELGGEDYVAVSETDFAAQSASGGFCIDWQAHGLRYGIPLKTLQEVEGGATLLVNLSRTVLLDVAALFPTFTVLNIMARPDTLARRLAERGRETADEIAHRLARQPATLPEGIDILTLNNDGLVKDTVETALIALGRRPHDPSSSRQEGTT